MVLVWSEHIFYQSLEAVCDILDLHNTEDEAGEDSRVGTEDDMEDIGQDGAVAVGDDTVVDIDAVVDNDGDAVVAVDIVGNHAVSREVFVDVSACWLDVVDVSHSRKILDYEINYLVLILEFKSQLTTLSVFKRKINDVIVKPLFVFTLKFQSEKLHFWNNGIIFLKKLLKHFHEIRTGAFN